MRKWMETASLAVGLLAGLCIAIAIKPSKPCSASVQIIAQSAVPSAKCEAGGQLAGIQGIGQGSYLVLCSCPGETPLQQMRPPAPPPMPMPAPHPAPPPHAAAPAKPGK